MPYKSKAQQRRFHVDPALQQYAHKWDEETKATKKGFKGLPERKKAKKKPTVKQQLRKQYGRNADIIHEEAGHSGDHREHYLVLHDKGESYHHPTTGAKLYKSQVWKKPVATKKKRGGKLWRKRK